jgi:hypothetical protein
MPMDINWVNAPDTNTDKKRIKILRWIDTLHDFYSERAGKNIKPIIDELYGGGVDSFIEKVNQSFPNSNPIVTSEIEPRTELFYTTYQVPGADDIQKTVNAFSAQYIISEYKKQDLLQSQMATPESNGAAKALLKKMGVNEDEEPTCLLLQMTNDKKDAFNNKSEINTLANVIKTFFEVTGEDPIFFLIDAISGRLDCMFQDIDEAYTIINALTIGDSANTSTDEKTGSDFGACGVEEYLNKFKRKEFFDEFPEVSLPYNVATPQYRITSNEFTEDLFVFWYQDLNGVKFSRVNKTSIEFCVGIKATQAIFKTPFYMIKSKSPNSGASVSTLKDVIRMIYDTAISSGDPTAMRLQLKKQIVDYFINDKTPQNQLNLAPIIGGMLDQNIAFEDIIKFLLDYKRAGDHEQVNAAKSIADQKKFKVVLVTGDLLCSLYARLMKQPCIYVQLKKRLYSMYNFKSDATLTPEEKAERNRLKLEAQEKNKERKLLAAAKNEIDITIEKIEELTAADANVNELVNANLAQWHGILDAFQPTTTNEDSFMKMHFLSLKCLSQKIERIQMKIGNYPELKTRFEPLRMLTLDAIMLEDTKKTELTALYQGFKAEGGYNEVLDFLFSMEAVPPVFADLNEKNISKFKLKALNYDNKTVNDIIKYFIEFNAYISLYTNSTSGRAPRSGSEAIRINKLSNLISNGYSELIKNIKAFVAQSMANYTGNNETTIDDNDAIYNNIKEIQRKYEEIFTATKTMDTNEFIKESHAEIKVIMDNYLNQLQPSPSPVSGGAARPQARTDVAIYTPRRVETTRLNNNPIKNTASNLTLKKLKTDIQSQAINVTANSNDRFFIDKLTAKITEFDNDYLKTLYESFIEMSNHYPTGKTMIEILNYTFINQYKVFYYDILQPNYEYTPEQYTLNYLKAHYEYNITADYESLFNYFYEYIFDNVELQNIPSFYKKIIEVYQEKTIKKLPKDTDSTDLMFFLNQLMQNMKRGKILVEQEYQSSNYQAALLTHQKHLSKQPARINNETIREKTYLQTLAARTPNQVTAASQKYQGRTPNRAAQQTVGGKKRTHRRREKKDNKKTHRKKYSIFP